MNKYLPQKDQVQTMRASLRTSVSSLCLSVFLLFFMLIACQPEPDAEPTLQMREFANGLLNPAGMAELPDGTILVAEEGTGKNDLSAGISMITLDGQVGRFISGLPWRALCEAVARRPYPLHRPLQPGPPLHVARARQPHTAR